MKKIYNKPFACVVHIDHQDIICASPFGPNSEGITFEGEEGDEEIYRPAKARGMWHEW